MYQGSNSHDERPDQPNNKCSISKLRVTLCAVDDHTTQIINAYNT